MKKEPFRCALPKQDSGMGATKKTSQILSCSKDLLIVFTRQFCVINRRLRTMSFEQKFGMVWIVVVYLSCQLVIFRKGK